jgi:hypothetical protein
LGVGQCVPGASLLDDWQREDNEDPKRMAG